MLFTSSLLSTSWIKTPPAQKLLVRTYGRHWNTCKLVFAGTRIWEPVQCWTCTCVYVNAALVGGMVVCWCQTNTGSG